MQTNLFSLHAFQSTQPEWAATHSRKCFFIWYKFQSTQPEWAATEAETNRYNAETISIHAARVGCD